MSRRSGSKRGEREIRVIPVRRDEVDVHQLARALLALAREQHPVPLEPDRREETDEPS